MPGVRLGIDAPPAARQSPRAMLFRRLSLSLAVCFFALASTAAAAAPAGLGRLIQFDVAQARSVDVRLPAKASGTYRVRGWLVPPGGKPIAVTRPRLLRVTPRSRSRRLPLTAAGVSTVASCQGGRVAVTGRRTKRRAGRTYRIRFSRTIELSPPACGGFNAIFNQLLVADAPLDPRSAELSKAFADEVRDEYAKNYPPTINVRRFSVPIVTVGPDQKDVPVTLDIKESWGDPVRKVLAEGAPIPDNARPADGTDQTLVVWQPSSDTTWEYWKARRAADGWHAKWGGRMRDMSHTTGVFPAKSTQGATATGLSTVGGLITAADVAAGRIDHALTIAIPNPKRGVWSLPALRTDGFDQSATAIPEGAHFRLDPALDIASLNLPPLIRLIAEATQRYGFYVRDRAGVVTFFGQDPGTGPNPFAPFTAAGSYGEQLKRFPWDRLQLMPMQLRTIRPGPQSGPSKPPPTTPPPPPSCGLPICP